MPAIWTPRAPGARDGRSDAGGPAYSLTLRPHNSMTPHGFVLFIGATAALLSIPLIGLLGTAALWFLLPFMLGALSLAWWLIRSSVTQREALFETLEIWEGRMTLLRHEPSGRELSWEGNPYWVRVRLHEKGGPVPNYVTLTGGARDVELGSFLSPEEREALAGDLDRALDEVRNPTAP